MPDYGHPLRFATFISPANSPAHRPVELAQLSERLGFDFVTFQDHPYKADFLDTWTLLSWAAARTEHIGLSGNVLNLPLRQPPAVLARATASLDLLSGGRMNVMKPGASPRGHACWCWAGKAMSEGGRLSWCTSDWT